MTVKTQPQMNAEIQTSFPDNLIGQITPAGTRQMLQDLSDTMFAGGTSAIASLQSTNNNFDNLLLISAPTNGNILTAPSLHAHLQVVAEQTQGALQGPLHGGGSAIIGASCQNTPGSLPSFPCAITGYAQIIAAGAGNTAFAGFFRGDLNATTGAIIGVEIDANPNSGVDSPAIWPPNLSFTTGTGNLSTSAYAIGIQVANTAANKAHTAFRAVTSGQLGGPSVFLSSFYADPPSATGSIYGLFIDAGNGAASTLGSTFTQQYSACLRNYGTSASNTHLLLQTTGASTPGNPVIQHQNFAGAVASLVSFQVAQGGSIFSNANTTLSVLPTNATVYNFYGVGADGASAITNLDTYNNGTATIAGSFIFRTARGIGSTPTNSITGDLIGRIGAKAFTNSTWTGANGATIDFLFTDSSPNNGMAIAFNNTPNGSFTRTEVARFLGPQLNIGSTGVPDALLTINANTGASTAPAAGTNLHILGTDLAVNQILMDVYQSTNALAFRRADNSQASKTATPLNASILNLGCASWDGSTYGNNVGLIFFTNSAQTGSDHSGYMIFKSTAVGSTTYQENMRFQSSGGLSIGTTTDGGAGSLVANKSVTLQNATAVPAGGTQDVGLLMSSTAHLGIFFGSGAPTLSAAQGSLYIRTDGSSTSTRLYVNTNGSTTWTNVTTAA